jgi:hypothetical protein
LRSIDKKALSFVPQNRRRANAVAICPHCHQPIATERLGVRWPPLKARIVDAIRAAGDVGVSSRELHHEVYRDAARARSVLSIKAHIWQINLELEATDWHIVSDQRGKLARFYLHRRPAS